MNKELLLQARNKAALTCRLNLRIPSILAQGEEFALQISVVGPDAMPVDDFDRVLSFENSAGIQGLPDKFRLERGAFAGCIPGLRAVGPDMAMVWARVGLPESFKGPSMVSSNPAWVFADPPYRLFWGDLHVHTAFSNCSAWRCLDPEWCYQYAQEASLLDFVAPADHLRGIASDPARWPWLQETARRYNRPGIFATMLGFESSHAQGFGGDNNVYFLDDDAPYFWVDREDMRGVAPQVHLRDLWRQMDQSGKAYFTVPHHTGRAQKYRSWDEDYHDPQREPLFEIYSSWGSSEMRHSRLPISGGNNDARSYFTDALKAGARFGVIASSDDHATLPGSVNHFRAPPFGIPFLNGFAHKGLAAVRAPRLTRADLFDAMRRRQTYATTHMRNLLDVTVGDAGMGQATPVDKAMRAGRQVRVRLTPHAASTARVILMRNGEHFDARTLRGAGMTNGVGDIVFEDREPFEKAALRDTPYHPAPFLVYYVRVEDGNGAHQWSSPIWLDEN